ncbi:MAG: Holliday junction resolvase RuvX [Bacteroidales bacterium]|jgi:putative Holliday junction resolvase|nr:Holliday junction resolvase RuvX [Bacteroidales bacterium]MBP5134502.1 Holliday junction resolvase RuvX [Paludibacteraceae bacterium]MBR6309724.1 Holliday junction resolvase RuvX [Paludibacteraceae bacterium]
MGRVLAIDYGQKRCGIAVSDTLQLIANGLDTIPTANLMSFLENYFQREPVDVVVFGLPRQMNNQESQSMQYIAPFVKRFKEKFPDKKVEFEDERFTSKMAFQTMIDCGLKKKERQNKALIDQVSATIILQSYLENKNYKI